MTNNPLFTHANVAPKCLKKSQEDAPNASWKAITQSHDFLNHINTHPLWNYTHTMHANRFLKRNHTLPLAHYTQKEPACSLTLSLSRLTNRIVPTDGHTHARTHTKHTHIHTIKQQHGHSAGFRGQLKSSIRLILLFPEMSGLQMAWLVPYV